MVSIWVFRYETRFWNWTSSFETGRPVLKLGEWQNNFDPSSDTGSSSSRTGCPKLAWCRFGNVNVPVLELDDQCRNWIGAEIGSKIYNSMLTVTNVAEKFRNVSIFSKSVM
jgi:hypothetical protein